MSSLLLRFTQFLPVVLFLYISRQSGWGTGFKIGAVVGIAQTLFLVYRKIPLSRLIAGANLFLLLGAVAFTFKIDLLLQALSSLMETTIFISLIFVFAAATLFTKSGVFEVQFTDPVKTKKYSYVLIGVAIVCAIWSYFNRGTGSMAGTAPFIVVLITKTLLQRKLTE